MKDQSTNDISDRPISEYVNTWEVELQGCHLRFERTGKLLKVQVLSVSDFKYYFGVFVVERGAERDKKEKSGHASVPQSVAEGLTKKYHEISFSKGQLNVELPRQFSRYHQKYTFPSLQKLQLHEYLFTQMTEIKQKEFELRSARRQIDQLETEKRSMLNQMKRINRELTNRIRHQDNANWRSRAKEWGLQQWNKKVAVVSKVTNNIGIKIRVHFEAITTVSMLVILALLLLELGL